MIEPVPIKSPPEDSTHLATLLRDALGLNASYATRGMAIIQTVEPALCGVNIIPREAFQKHLAGPIFVPLDALASFVQSPIDLCISTLVFVLNKCVGSSLKCEKTSRRPLIPILTREANANKYVTSPFAQEIVTGLSRGRHVIVTGKSASGKTIAATQAALSLVHQGTAVAWLDLSEPDRSACDILYPFVTSRADSTFVLFVDDSQANPSELEELSILNKLFSLLAVTTFNVAVLTWASSTQVAVHAFQTGTLVSVRADKILPELVSSQLKRQVRQGDRQHLEHAAAGDLVVAGLCISFLNKNGRFPSSDELAREALDAFIGPTLQLDAQSAEILYRTAALSQFEIDVSLNYLELISRINTCILLDQRILRRNGAYVSIGHRSTARLILRGLVLMFPIFEQQFRSASRLAVDYLRMTDSKQLITTLERLDIARLQHSQYDQHGTRFLVTLWSTFRLLLSSLARSCDKDPTWRDDTGSAAIASRVLSEFNYECANSTVAHLRTRWKLSLNEGIAPQPPPPNERKDFDEIRRCMTESQRVPPPGYAERVEDIDFDRMHRTWAIGLLLGMEAGASDYSHERITSLKSIAFDSVDNFGALYPRRVPWVTARVLIGLSQAGESVESSAIVRKACEWLLTEAPAGPCEFGAWNPHTGIWNTVLGTTAMCVNALVRCGIDPTHPSVDLANNYLMDARAEWSRSGQEIDCAFALETFMLSGASWRDFTPELTRLIYWAHDPHIWDDVVLDASQAKDESLKIPLIASSMVGIIWSIVRSELPLLLEDLSIGGAIPDPLTEVEYKRDLQVIFYRLDEIRSVIRKNIEERLHLISRSGGVGERALRQKLDEFRLLAERCESLRDSANRISEDSNKVRADELAALKKSLNSIGADLFGSRWEAIK